MAWQTPPPSPSVPHLAHRRILFGPWRHLNLYQKQTAYKWRFMLFTIILHTYYSLSWYFICWLYVAQTNNTFIMAWTSSQHLVLFNGIIWRNCRVMAKNRANRIPGFKSNICKNRIWQSVMQKVRPPQTTNDRKWPLSLTLHMLLLRAKLFLNIFNITKTLREFLCDGWLY